MQTNELTDNNTTLDLLEIQIKNSIQEDEIKIDKIASQMKYNAHEIKNNDGMQFEKIEHKVITETVKVLKLIKENLKVSDINTEHLSCHSNVTLIKNKISKAHKNHLADEEINNKTENKLSVTKIEY